MSVGFHPVTGRSPTDRVFGLDLLRAVAIMGVVCAHGFVVLDPHLVGVLGIFGHGGFYGVELFFVQSDFLVGQILIRQASALSRAANVAALHVRRWFRTFPLFFFFSASASGSNSNFDSIASTFAKLSRMDSSCVA